MNNTKLMESTISDLRENVRGEFAFKVKGYEVIATFTDKTNNDIFSRIQEILLGRTLASQDEAKII